MVIEHLFRHSNQHSKKYKWCLYPTEENKKNSAFIVRTSCQILFCDSPMALYDLYRKNCTVCLVSSYLYDLDTCSRLTLSSCITLYSFAKKKPHLLPLSNVFPKWKLNHTCAALWIISVWLGVRWINFRVHVRAPGLAAQDGQKEDLPKMWGSLWMFHHWSKGNEL